METTATEMFEALGWERHEDSNCIEWGYSYDFTRQYEQGKLITFYKVQKWSREEPSYETQVLGRHFDMNIDLPLHRAITQQLIELGAKL